MAEGEAASTTGPRFQTQKFINRLLRVGFRDEKECSI